MCGLVFPTVSEARGIVAQTKRVPRTEVSNSTKNVRTQKTEKKAPVTEATLGANPDLNLDGKVDAADIAILLGAWGTCPVTAGCPADLTFDGQVETADLTQLVNAWTM